jgi:regulator of sigma E protease
MNALSISPGMLLDLLTFLLGFGFIVFIHELGHFLAARWAGIRVLAFAIGFGPAICSFRRGMGFKQGSSEADYRRLVESGKNKHVSSTEYRFNWLPFGGYVKMLGQDDVRPGATSTASDSYQSVKPWKRMIVISAGVVMNIILAAILFVIVFMAGLKTEPAIVGRVFPATPAARTIATNAAAAGIKEPGLQPGDRVVEINGKEAREFNDIILATTMAERGQPVSITVRRHDVSEPLRFDVIPETSLTKGLLEIGIEPPRSGRIVAGRTDAERQTIEALLASQGLAGVKPGMSLVGTSGGRSLSTFAEADRLLRSTNGDVVNLKFATHDSTGQSSNEVTIPVRPRPTLQVDFMKTAKGVTPVEHLLGLVPVMTVLSADGKAYERGYAQGLRTGDIFARIGSIEYPSVAAGMAEIRAHKGKNIPLTLLRQDGAELKVVSLEASVTDKGTIGFAWGDTGDTSALVALPLRSVVKAPKDGALSKSDWPEANTPAAGLITSPGAKIEMVGGQPVTNFAEIRERLRSETKAAFENGAATAQIALAITMPGSEADDGFAPSRPVVWTLNRDAIVALHELGWDNPLPSMLFEPEQFVLKASGPAEAVQFGIARTHGVMTNTYMTFVRLFQQTVKIEHLKGPVGIAHLGTLIAERGPIWMLFFLALISVNLAVVNFLPLPIVDGGQFLLLVYEQIRGKPAPIGFQNAITLAGFALIGSIFLLVTFNDIKNLLNL